MEERVLDPLLAKLAGTLHQRDTEAIVVKFSGEICRPCPVRSLCTSAKKGGRQLTIRPPSTSP
ncbi:transposase [Nonomuraea sp. G32]|nr:transposase [Nonomuraea sp. G32]MDP4510645.1 transposase [Nonomuraea sp. G32]